MAFPESAPEVCNDTADIHIESGGTCIVSGQTAGVTCFLSGLVMKSWLVYWRGA